MAHCSQAADVQSLQVALYQRFLVSIKRDDRNSFGIMVCGCSAESALTIGHHRIRLRKNRNQIKYTPDRSWR
jgi:hypothetical protein